MEVSGAPCILISSRLMREAHLQLPAVIYLGLGAILPTGTPVPGACRPSYKEQEGADAKQEGRGLGRAQGGQSNFTSMIFIHGPVSDVSLAKLSRPFVRAMVLQ